MIVSGGCLSRFSGKRARTVRDPVLGQKTPAFCPIRQRYGNPPADSARQAGTTARLAAWDDPAETWEIDVVALNSTACISGNFDKAVQFSSLDRAEALDAVLASLEETPTYAGGMALPGEMTS